MKRFLFFKHLWPWIFAGVFLGGIVHISSILLMPYYAGQDAATRLEAMGRVNESHVLPAFEAGKIPFSFAEPNAAYAICPYNISIAPLRIQIESGRSYISLVFLGQGGSSFYSLSDKASANGTLDIRLASFEQLNQIELQDTEDQPVQELRIRAQKPTGVVLVRSVPSSKLDYKDAVARVQKFTCRLEG